MFSASDDMIHAKIPLKKPVVQAQHPFRHKDNHDRLLNYIQARLFLGKEARDGELPRWVNVDKSVAGWMRLTEEDKARQKKQDKTGAPQAVTMNLPLNFVHLDDMMTYFAATFSPTRGMFYQMGKKDEVGPASQIVTVMNNHAQYAGYYRETLLGIYSCLKYNSGGYQVFWSKDEGPKLQIGEDGKKAVVTETKWQGNRMKAIDKYNFLSDPHVHPTKLHCDGEFAATVEMWSFYKLQRAASRGQFYNCDEALDNAQGLSESTYYRHPPRETQLDSDKEGNSTDWKSILSGTPGGGLNSGFELTELHIHLNPTEFGLIEGSKTERNRLEQWRFTVLNDKYIIDAMYMNNIHGYLPFFMGVLNDDAMGTSQKSPAEILKPLQDFASFLLNVHIQASRKNIWGFKFYDPSMFQMKDIPAGEVAALVPMNPSAYGRDVRTGIYTHSETLDTKQTMKDLESVMGIISQFFPTQSLPSQIANIDRAVDSQVAAVQQGANRRQQKSARLLDDTMFRNVRHAMYYNLIQYQPDNEEVTDFYTGKVQKINLTELKNTDLPFIIGQGLKAIDRQAAANAIQQIIFALIQAPQAAQGIDLLGLINYWTSMIDIDIDMSAFEKAIPVEPGGSGGAGAVNGVDAAGAPIMPATDPSKLTAPIYS